ncbi:MAG TPA: phosphoribosylformylglycinamidine cyclo-ligase [Victivallales bacterium]|nr:phosphoribosylformylglycinamidine cyclo-ligase [Victivallales bacterium]HRR28341.1 phosphoribosylformylglycinamidine cyclo-ligase [Victivallales bacterium]HRU02267.1 phosphoribosylformylglycinamidine cyclo-ligase [Victivallales bacterium]
MNKVRSDLYKEAGVDIDLASSLLKKLKPKFKKAMRKEMLTQIGGFGGLFQINIKKYKNPVLVSSIDGVGTKILVALMMNKYSNIGMDIVNHCINDIAVQGAEPIYFMDYIGIGKLKDHLYEDVLSGIIEACKNANCALLGGETAEMPGVYQDEFDLVGVITGIVEKDKIITGERIKVGYAAIGISSNGLHTNGYSLARKILFEQLRYTPFDEFKELGESIGDALLKPHLSYLPAIKAAIKHKLNLDGIAHITGGGLYDNVPRILPEKVGVQFQTGILPIPPIFKMIIEGGNISKEEAYRVFNMGIGMVWFLPNNEAEEAIKICKKTGFNAAKIGEVIKGNKNVIID